VESPAVQRDVDAPRDALRSKRSSTERVRRDRFEGDRLRWNKRHFDLALILWAANGIVQIVKASRYTPDTWGEPAEGQPQPTFDMIR